MSDLLTDKLFIFAQKPQVSEAEKDITSLIADKELIQFKSVSLVKNGENYDSYKLIGDKNLFLKLSLDESNVFKSQINPIHSPKVLAVGSIDYGDEFFYLIEEFVDSQTVLEMGDSILSKNHNKLSAQIKEYGIESLAVPSFQEALQQRFEKSDFQKDEQYNRLVQENSENYQLLVSELTEAKDKIQREYSSKFGGNSLVHGNVSPSNLFLGNQGFVFSSWEKSFRGNRLFDLAEICFNFEVSKNVEYGLFLDLRTNEEWDSYLTLKSYWSNVRLIDLFCDYVKEVFVYNSKRDDEILKIIRLFYKNISLFENLETFKKNREQLLTFFGQSTS